MAKEDARRQTAKSATSQSRLLPWKTDRERKSEVVQEGSECNSNVENPSRVVEKLSSVLCNLSSNHIGVFDTFGAQA
jgi:hypothetical protein